MAIHPPGMRRSRVARTYLASAGTSTGVEVSTSSTGPSPYRLLELVERGHGQRPGDVDRVVVRPGAAACVRLPARPAVGNTPRPDEETMPAAAVDARRRCGS
jgi:hypothetical protein